MGKHRNKEWAAETRDIAGKAVPVTRLDDMTSEPRTSNKASTNNEPELRRANFGDTHRTAACQSVVVAMLSGPDSSDL